VRRSIPITIVLLSALTLGQTTRTAKTSNLEADAQRFLGAWRVLSVTDTRPDGTSVPDLYLGPHPIGFIIYEATGHMCFGAMNPGRTKWTDELNGTPAEMSAATEGYDSYCGTYEINDERKTVTHHVRVALVPNDVQTDLVRKYEFSGNQLKLTATNGLKPEFKFWTVTFEHATPAR
jgi:Lipocalin-like domain